MATSTTGFNGTRWLTLLLGLALAASLFVLTITSDLSMFHPSFFRQLHSKEGDVDAAGMSSEEAGRAAEKSIVIFTIALNGYDARPLIKSLRTHGEFDGEIVLVGDECSPKPDEKYHVHYIKVNRPETRMEAKGYKQQVFDLTNADQIFYVDSDMLVNKPIHHFLKAFLPHDPECTAYMFRERWYTHSDFNAGTIFMDRELSSEWLKEWQTTISQHEEWGRDQNSLGVVMDSGKYKLCPLPSGHITYVADLFTRYSLRGIHATTFTHWTTAKNEPESLCR